MNFRRIPAAGAKALVSALPSPEIKQQQVVSEERSESSSYPLQPRKISSEAPFQTKSGREDIDGPISEETNTEPAVPKEESIGGSNILRLPERVPLDLTAEELVHARSFTSKTLTKLCSLNRIGREGAQDRMTQWHDMQGWNTIERDFLVTILDRTSSKLSEELNSIASRLHAKSREIPCCDFVDCFNEAVTLAPETMRILQIASCVPICSVGDGAGLVIGSINPVVAVEVAEIIEKTPLVNAVVPFVTPMRLEWNSWVSLLLRYGF